jgi:hypothetical protein
MTFPKVDDLELADGVCNTLSQLEMEKQRLWGLMSQTRQQLPSWDLIAPNMQQQLDAAWITAEKAGLWVETILRESNVINHNWHNAQHLNPDSLDIDDEKFLKQNADLRTAVCNSGCALDELKLLEQQYKALVQEACFYVQQQQQQSQQQSSSAFTSATSAVQTSSSSSPDIRLKPLAPTAPLIQELQTLKSEFEKKYPGKQTIKPGDAPHSPSSYCFEFSAPASTTPGQEKAEARIEAEKFLADQAKAPLLATFLLEEFTVNETGGETPSGRFYFSCGDGAVYKGTKVEIHQKLMALVAPTHTPPLQAAQMSQIVSGLARFRNELNIPTPQAITQGAKNSVAGVTTTATPNAAAAAADLNDPRGTPPFRI